MTKFYIGGEVAYQKLLDEGWEMGAHTDCEGVYPLTRADERALFFHVMAFNDLHMFPLRDGKAPLMASVPFDITKMVEKAKRDFLHKSYYDILYKKMEEFFKNSFNRKK